MLASPCIRKAMLILLIAHDHVADRPQRLQCDVIRLVPDAQTATQHIAKRFGTVYRRKFLPVQTVAFAHIANYCARLFKNALM
jgi:hypothetical protein